jgi:hypothetical protein
MSALIIHARTTPVTAEVKSYTEVSVPFALLRLSVGDLKVEIYLNDVADAERIAYAITDSALTARCLAAIAAEKAPLAEVAG